MQYISLFFALLLFSCTVPPVKIDSELQKEAVEFPVKINLGMPFAKNKYIEFGEFKTQNLRIGKLQQDHKYKTVTIKQNSSFFLTDTTTNDRVQVQCEEFCQKSYSDYGSGQMIRLDSYYYKITTSDSCIILLATQQGADDLRISGIKSMIKELTKPRHSAFQDFTFDSATIRLESVFLMTKDSCFDGGYLHWNSRRMVAFNMLNRKYRVWMMRDMEERTRLALAAITAALLLKDFSTVGTLY